MVREQAFYDEFVVWSGTDTWQKKNGAVIPRYLWKVCCFASEYLLLLWVHLSLENAPNVWANRDNDGV